MSRRIIVHRKESSEKKVTLQPDTRVEILGRITKIIQRRKGHDTLFQVITPKSRHVLTCTSSYFSPIMVGDAIFGHGFVNSSGDKVDLSKPPFICPGNDLDSVTTSCICAIKNRGAVNLILTEIGKGLRPDQDLGSLLDTLAVSFDRIGKSVVTYLVPESLHGQTEELLKWWYKKRCLRRLYLLDFTNTEISASGLNPLDLFQVAISNPYRISSLSLERCETILLRVGKSPQQTDRYCGEIMRKVKSYLDRKWSYVPIDEMISFYADFRNHQTRLISEYGLLVCPSYVALRSIVMIETEVATFIRSLIEMKNTSLCDTDMEGLDTILDQHRCDPDQRKAIQGVVQSHISIITGGAGTGKTTTLRSLIAYLETKGDPFILTAFTGKAVSRIKEVVPQTNPLTLNRQIGLGSVDDSSIKYVIIDESSMLETKLFLDFIRTFPLTQHRYRLIFIGDLNQLSPIGWGCLFHQLIKSNRIPIFHLTICHRTEGFGILNNIKLIFEGSFLEEYGDFRLAFGKTPLQIIEEYHLPIEHVRILAPFVDTVAEQNRVIQDYFSTGRPFVDDPKGRRWLIQDRVMMTKNNYTIDVMNGQEGFVAYFDPNREGVYVAFNGKAHLFTFLTYDLERIISSYPPSVHRYLDVDTLEEITPAVAKRRKFYDEGLFICGENKVLFYNVKRYLDDASGSGLDEDSREFPPVDHLIHSYALTVHKSQGSEWDYVIVLLPPRGKGSDFVTRNLLHVAISRGKKMVFCLGSRQSWIQGILNQDKEPSQLLGDKISE